METIGRCVRTRLIAAIGLLAISAVSGIAQAERLDLLSAQISNYFQAGNLELALPLAMEFRDLAIKADGRQGERVTRAYENLGAIYRAQEDYTNAVASLSAAVELRKAGGSLSTHLPLLQALGACQIKASQFAEASATFRLALSTMGGEDEKKHFQWVLDAANAEAQAKNYVEANELYKRTFKIFMNFYEPNDPLLKDLLAYRTCYFERFQRNEELIKDYREANKSLNETNAMGVKNGKATSLERPDYSLEARRKRLGGTVYVLVDIDEKGRVTDASAICSDPMLASGAIGPARRARFTPTTKNGVPIATFGLVTYRFVP